MILGMVIGINPRQNPIVFGARSSKEGGGGNFQLKKIIYFRLLWDQKLNEKPGLAGLFFAHMFATIPKIKAGGSHLAAVKDDRSVISH